LKLEEKFQSKLNSGFVKQAKPDPELYLLSAKNLAVKPEKCLAIEDSLYGLRAAKAAGMKCVVLLSRYSQDKDFSQADLVIKGFDELTPEKLAGLGVKA
jgi:beta-phosphoglucomutase-like phosphatase (HAD superfamily)